MKAGLKMVGRLRKVMLPAMILLAAGCQKNHLGIAADTLEEIGDNIYYAEINGYDGLDGLLAQGGVSSTDELAEYITNFLSCGPFGKCEVDLNPGVFGCSTLALESPAGDRLMGRNFDWDNCQALILKIKPSKGYSSVSTVNLDFLGFGDKYKPKGMINRFKALAGIFVPLDGINEKGLVVADLVAGDDVQTDQRTDKPDITTTSAIRLLLDKAGNVDEALEILNHYDMHSDIGTAHHLMIADASGRSVCVEWVSGVMYATETDILTNHYICDIKYGESCYGEGEKNTFERFCTLEQAKEAAGGKMTERMLAETMLSVGTCPDGKSSGTQWTVVFNLSDPSGTWYRKCSSESSLYCSPF